MSDIITEFAPAKVNLALHVLGRRNDGYHDLDSVVAFADVGDVLTFAHSDRTTLSVDGAFAGDIPVTSDNLVLKAFAALKQYGDVPPVAMCLTKNLPVASGIGGGSADAAAALRGLIRLAGLRLDPETLRGIALSLGADVPVCLHGKACRMQGVGDIITPLELLPASAILLVNPLQACGTADVFRAMGLKRGDVFGAALDLELPLTWRNDMTLAAQQVLPVIAEVLALPETLPGVRGVRMSGSGATCFALMDNYAEAAVAGEQLKHASPNWWIAPARLA